MAEANPMSLSPMPRPPLVGRHTWTSHPSRSMSRRRLSSVHPSRQESPNFSSMSDQRAWELKAVCWGVLSYERMELPRRPVTMGRRS